MVDTPISRTLLIVDDEPGVLKALQRTLGREDYEIYAFDRPFDALEMLFEKEVGVIISDQCMPQMEGQVFLAKAGEYQPRAIRIAITGYSDEAYEQRAAIGADAWRYLTKPWDNDELRQIVADAFERYERSLSLADV